MATAASALPEASAKVKAPGELRRRNTFHGDEEDIRPIRGRPRAASIEVEQPGLKRQKTEHADSKQKPPAPNKPAAKAAVKRTGPCASCGDSSPTESWQPGRLPGSTKEVSLCQKCGLHYRRHNSLIKLYCSFCHKTEKKYDSTKHAWLTCHECKQQVHERCANQAAAPAKVETSPFVCTQCRSTSNAQRRLQKTMGGNLQPSILSPRSTAAMAMLSVNPAASSAIGTSVLKDTAALAVPKTKIERRDRALPVVAKGGIKVPPATTEDEEIDVTGDRDNVPPLKGVGVGLKRPAASKTDKTTKGKSGPTSAALAGKASNQPVVPASVRPKKNSRMALLAPLLQANEKVAYRPPGASRNSGKHDPKDFKTGCIVNGAIQCDCCRQFFTPSNFEKHSSSHPHKTPYSAIFVVRTGKSLQDMEKEFDLPAAQARRQALIQKEKEQQVEMLLRAADRVKTPVKAAALLAAKGGAGDGNGKKKSGLSQSTSARDNKKKGKGSGTVQASTSATAAATAGTAPGTNSGTRRGSSSNGGRRGSGTASIDIDAFVTPPGTPIRKHRPTPFLSEDAAGIVVTAINDQIKGIRTTNGSSKGASSKNGNGKGKSKSTAENPNNISAKELAAQNVELQKKCLALASALAESRARVTELETQVEQLQTSSRRAEPSQTWHEPVVKPTGPRLMTAPRSGSSNDKKSLLFPQDSLPRPRRDSEPVDIDPMKYMTL